MALSKDLIEVAGKSNLLELMQKYQFNVQQAEKCADSYLIKESIVVALNHASGRGVPWTTDRQAVTNQLAAQINCKMKDVGRLQHVQSVGIKKLADDISEDIINKLSEKYFNPQRWGYPSRISDKNTVVIALNENFDAEVAFNVEATVKQEGVAEYSVITAIGTASYEQSPSGQDTLRVNAKLVARGVTFKSAQLEIFGILRPGDGQRFLNEFRWSAPDAIPYHKARTNE